jgi:HEPN domain-containing protein
MEPRFMNERDQWFKIALRDLEVATLAWQKNYPHQAAYFAQQAAEKALKGYLITTKTPYKRTHDLEELVDSCLPSTTIFIDLEWPAYFLTDYATCSRYPGKDYEDDLTRYEAQELIKHAKNIILPIFKILKMPIFKKG